MKKTVLVTSGGTSEPIDTIRSITNKSTGKLGSLIADRFAAEDAVQKVYYLYAKGAVMPASEKVIPIAVETTEDLLDAVTRLLRSEKTDAVVHAMAVSDYRVRAVAGAEELWRAAQESRDAAEWVGESRNLRSRDRKISSYLSNPVVVLEQTPKILPLFRELQPDAVVVGFKLLSGERDETLIRVAHELLLKNKCDYVFANDYTDVASGNHKGYLVFADGTASPVSGKAEIAGEIVRTVIGGFEA